MADVPTWVESIVRIIESLGVSVAMLIVFVLAIWRGSRWFGGKVITPLLERTITFIDALQKTTATQADAIERLAESTTDTTQSIAKLAQAGVDTNSTITQMAGMQQQILEHMHRQQKFIEGLMSQRPTYVAVPPTPVTVAPVGPT